ncbi:hypothetical protein TSOC_007287 [Tetrabaena socialis]|uniref:Uncharacterized protein n=1 Tax=Tetrabaena socialis TaxID=47790 RepID=A0A2J8A1G5_9CHLO|nr:hypothetical protein TSOC_007287 [Tetrabaena socialis]|eukprot:PNH06366.1 hypothetical protein TSOC_007287 [Tetrabaena socialis]
MTARDCTAVAAAVAFPFGCCYPMTRAATGRWCVMGGRKPAVLPRALPPLGRRRQRGMPPADYPSCPGSSRGASPPPAR